MASLLVAILIAVSCAATACSIKCDLHSMLPACHDVGVRSNHTMAGMEATMSLSSEAQAVLPLASAGHCEQHVCVERPAFVTSRSATADHLSLVQQALIITLIEWPDAKSLPNWLSDPPPLRHSTLVSLHTILRV